MPSKIKISGPRNAVIASSLATLIFTFGCCGLLYMYQPAEKVFQNPFEWLPEIFIGGIVLLLLVCGIPLLKNRHAVPVATYRLVSVLLICLVLCDVGVRIATINQPRGSAFVYFASITISAFVMRGRLGRIQQKMVDAREKDWLVKNLDETQWTWDPAHYPEFDGPLATNRQREALRPWERLHYIMPGLAALFSAIFGRVEAITFSGLLIVYMGVVFFAEAIRQAGIIKQLILWEVEKGERFTLPSYERKTR